MNNAAARNKTLITVGLDLGDRRHTYYVLDEAGKMAKEGSLANTREQLATMARSYPGATVVIHLMPEVLIDSTNWRWNTKKRTSVGTATTTDAAII
jgi:hypothetical protein